MSCPRCLLRLSRQLSHHKIRIPSRRAFHTSPKHSRLGAFTYAQEWQTGTYHFNKALTKTLPVASLRADALLTAYATQQKRRADPSNPLYNQITRTNIAAQRRQQERIFISKSTAKDFGDRIEVSAYVYDGVGAAEREKEAFRKKKMGVKEGEQGAQGEGQRRRRRPVGRTGSVPGGGSAVGGSTGGGYGAARGPPRRAPVGGGAPVGTAFRRVILERAGPNAGSVASRGSQEG